MGTERRLLEEPRHELVVLHEVNILLLEGTLPASQAERLVDLQLTTTIVTIIFFLRHRDARGRDTGGFEIN